MFPGHLLAYPAHGAARLDPSAWLRLVAGSAVDGQDHALLGQDLHQESGNGGLALCAFAGDDNRGGDSLILEGLGDLFSPPWSPNPSRSPLTKGDSGDPELKDTPKPPAGKNPSHPPSVIRGSDPGEEPAISCGECQSSSTLDPHSWDKRDAEGLRLCTPMCRTHHCRAGRAA